ncbi:hypothetical protein BASA60_006314 [Batrachochytrium salamandrivorans]|nr:hypothetical protein BASA60_006314 [Batrachochytrium salamandrivorans]KAH9268769.1 hypothetical protein BASA84_000068 [Batrachochytrium salamandrivorans]
MQSLYQEQLPSPSNITPSIPVAASTTEPDIPAEQATAAPSTDNQPLNRLLSSEPPPIGVPGVERTIGASVIPPNSSSASSIKDPLSLPSSHSRPVDHSQPLLYPARLSRSSSGLSDTGLGIGSRSSAAVSTAIAGIAYDIELIVKPHSANKFATSTLFASLKDLAGPHPLPFPTSSVWDRILRSDIPSALTIQDAFDLDQAAQEFVQNMATNNCSTFNFNTLVLYFLTQLRQMRNIAYEGEWSSEAHNAMFSVRIFTKHFAETLSKKHMIDIFEHDRTLFPVPSDSIHTSLNSTHYQTTSPLGGSATSVNSMEGERVSTSFRKSMSGPRSLLIDPCVAMDKRKRSLALLEELLHVVIYANTTTSLNYEFYLEAINLLLVLLSSQMIHVSSEVVDKSYFLLILLDNLSHFAKGILGRLLENFIGQQPKPSYGNEDPIKASPLAEKSILLLMIISGQGASESINYYRDAFSSLVDSGTLKESPSTILSEMATSPLHMPFKDIYRVIIKCICKDETCLVLYMLLLKNREFRMYVLSRTDPDVLLLPLLHQIYDAVDKKTNYSKLYILLTIMLILSQDDVYNENNHKVAITPPPWFTERIIRSVTLGGLVMLVLIRVIQANISRHKDIYFHTTSLAILANMSSTVIGMHSVVAQRLVNLYESISKKYFRLSSRIESVSNMDSPTLASELSNHEDTHFGLDCDGETELTVCSDLIALLLEIINSVLIHTLKSNQQLVYALLHRRAMFSQFRMHSRFADLIQNIDTVISHFHGRLIEADLRMPSVDDILHLIDETGQRWSSANLREFPDVKFQYEEETEYQRFFVPYIWSLVYQHSHIYWNPLKAELLYVLDPDFQISNFAGAL